MTLLFNELAFPHAGNSDRNRPNESVGRKGVAFLGTCAERGVTTGTGAEARGVHVTTVQDGAQ